jgi:hypothetical protein
MTPTHPSPSPGSARDSRAAVAGPRALVDLWPLLLLLLLAVGTVFWVYSAIPAGGFALPLGLDGMVWEATALLNREQGGGSHPPLLPFLASLATQGPSLTERVQLLNLLALGLLVAAAGLAPLLVIGAGPRGAAAALLAGSATVALTDLAPYALQTQPEILTALSLSLAGAALLWLAKDPRPLALLAAGAATGLAFSAREHGAVLLPLAALIAAISCSGGMRTRTSRAALLLATSLAVHWMLLRTLSPEVAFTEGSFAKATVAVRDLHGMLSGQATPKPLMMSPEQHQSAQGLAALTVTAGQSLRTLRPWAVLFGLHLLACALVASARSRRLALALLVPILVLAPTLLVWIQPRHVQVVLPLACGGAAIALAMLLERIPPRAGAALSLTAAVVVLAAGFHPSRDAMRQAITDARQEERTLGEDYAYLLWVRERFSLLHYFVIPSTHATLKGKSGLHAIELCDEELAWDTAPPWPHMAWRTVVLQREPPGRAWVPAGPRGPWEAWVLGPPEGVPGHCLWGELDSFRGIGHLEDRPRELARRARGEAPAMLLPDDLIQPAEGCLANVTPTRP